MAVVGKFETLVEWNALAFKTFIELSLTLKSLKSFNTITNLWSGAKFLQWQFGEAKVKRIQRDNFN